MLMFAFELQQPQRRRQLGPDEHRRPPRVGPHRHHHQRPGRRRHQGSCSGGFQSSSSTSSLPVLGRRRARCPRCMPPPPPKPAAAPTTVRTGRARGNGVAGPLPRVAPQAMDTAAAARLWEVSCEKLTGVSVDREPAVGVKPPATEFESRRGAVCGDALCQLVQLRNSNPPSPSPGTRGRG